MNDSGKVVLHQLLCQEGVRLALQGMTRNEVLRELVAQIPQLAGQHAARQQLFQALVEREEMHSTGIGDGIALPHARNALPGLLDRPIIVFGRHPQGIDFRAVDGKPARLFFLIVAPTVPEHLGILARISRLLRNPDLRHQLLTATTPQAVVAAVREAEMKLG